MKYSFGVLKPDCIERGLVQTAFRLMSGRGLEVVYHKQQRLNRKDAEFLYARCRQSSFFPDLVEFMTSGDVVIYVVESLNGGDAIRTLNSVVGHTDPTQAKPGTIRGLGESVRRNLSHSTIDTRTFTREVQYFLSDEQLRMLGLNS